MPKRILARQSVPVKPVLDLLEGRLLDDVPLVPGKVGHRPPRERPAGPRAPPALVTAGLVHPVGVVLEMDPRVPDEDVPRACAA